MPTLGGVYIPDTYMPRAVAPEPTRPTLGEIVGGAAQQAAGQLRYGLPLQYRTLQGDLTPEDEKFYTQGLARASQAAAAAAPASIQDVMSGRTGVLRFALENLAASVPQTGAILAGGLGGAAVGGPGGAVVGAIAAGTPLFSASNVARAVDETGALDRGSAQRALAAAPLQAVADAAIGRFLPGAGKVLGDLASTQAGGFLRRTATSMVKAGGSEAVTEAAQQFGERYAAGLPVSDADAAGEYVNAAVTAFAVGGVLGAGGGFRRTGAMAKPADQVTENDMNQHTDSVLNGSGRALPPPEQFGRSSTGTMIVDSEGRAYPAFPNPEDTAAVAVQMANLPRPANVLALDESTTPAALAQQFEAVQATQQAQLDAAAPNVLAQTPLPGFEEGQAFVPPATDTSVAALASVPNVVPEPVAAPEAARPLQSVDLADLDKARRHADVDPDMAAAIDAEMVFRKQENPFLGVRLNQDIASLRDLPREDQIAGVRRLLEEGDSRTGTFDLAQNLGIDPNAMGEPDIQAAEGLEAQDQLSTRGRAAAGPAPTTPTQTSSEFAPQWEQLKRDAGITRMRSGRDTLSITPANLEDAQAQVIRALADDKLAPRGKEASQVERLAQKMGLITDDSAMDITPLGRQAFLTTPEGLEETVSAAQQQGFAGAQASNFDRGVRAQAAGEATPPAFASFDDMAAYEAGKVWAQDFVRNGDTRTAAQTEAIRARQDTRKTGTAVDRRSIERRQLTPAQVQQQSLNNLLDRADWTGVRDADAAMVRRMVRDGASALEVGQAIEQVQGGQTLFRQAERVPYEAPAARVERGQPIARDAQGVRLDGGPVLEDTKGAQRRESRQAVRKFEVQQELRAAQNSGDLSRSEFMKLSMALKNAKTAADISRVVKGLPGFSAEARGANRIADPVLEQAIDGKTVMEVLDHLIATAPTALDAGIMRAVRDAAKLMEKIGVPINFNVTHVGAEAPAAMVDGETRALTWAQHNPAQVDIWINGADLGDQTGMNWETVAHELVHAVTLASVTDVYRNSKQYRNTQTGRAVQELDRLANQITDFVNQRIESGAELTAFEQRFLNNEINALADVNEIISWGLTNPDMQEYLDSIPYSPKQSMWDKFVDVVRKILGLPTNSVTALDALLHVSEAIITAPEAELRTVWGRNRTDSSMAAMRAAPTEGNVSAANRTAQATNATTQSLAQTATEFVNKLNPRDFANKAQRMVLGWLSHNQVDRNYGERVPGTLEHSDAHRSRVAIRSRFEQMGSDAYQSFEQLEKANPKAAERVGQLMATTTEFQLDTNKSWDEHTWLHDDPNAKALERLHGEAVKLANDLKRGDGAGWKVYSNFRALNEAQNFARMAVGLHSLVATDPELSLGVDTGWVSPADAFAQTELSDPAAIRTYWAKALDDQVAAATEFVREKRGELATASVADQRAIGQRLTPVEQQISSILEAKAAMARAPYFHLGRFGDHFGSAEIRKGEDGRVDPEAQRKVAEALEAAGFTHAQISADNTRPNIALRFDTRDQAEAFRDLALQLQKQGLLSEKAIKAGPRDMTSFGTSDELPAFVNSFIQNLETSPMFAEEPGMSDSDKAALRRQLNQMKQAAIDTYVESQPDTSISKMLARRHTVAGYDKNMVRNWAHRWRVGSLNIANQASAPRFNRAFTDMKAQYNDELVANRLDAQGQPLPPGDPYTVLNVMNELKMRDARVPVDETADVFDKMRAFAHSYFLGLSPAYGLINMTQLGVTALPEMAKKHGYTKSFHAMRRASTQALAIVKAVGSEAAKLGWKHWGDVAITDNVLKKAGIDDKTREFIQHMLATGTIDIGSMARSLGQVADDKGVGGTTDTYLKLSSSIGLYTETFSRLVTALAARDLHGGYGLEAQKYATKTVSEAMFDYQTWNTARQLGKKGFLGPVTPLLTQFMSYQVQITEKLYSEAMDAFGKARPGESAEAAKQRQTEARRFLMGHLAAVTTLAGSLGLPFATVFATVIERMVDATDDDDDEPFDATAAYRNFLSSVFGKEVAEVVARGAPRALGFDISQRAGEQNLLPFSEFFADRRSWKDAVSDSAGRSLGAVPSMLINVLDGGGQIADGDLLGGMKTMLPVAYKGPTEVYRMTTEGYVDSKGNRLPMSPTASSYLWQLLGFSPAAKAEYGEARAEQAARRGQLQREAGKLRTSIVRAVLSGDTDSARSLVADAMQFDEANPEFAIIPSLGASVAASRQAQAQSRALNVPMGVSMRDVAGQRLTQYANF